MGKMVRIHYRNWRGLDKHYLIEPISLRYTSTDYYPDVQWILFANKFVDGREPERRTFALSRILSWKEAPERGDNESIIDVVSDLLEALEIAYKLLVEEHSFWECECEFFADGAGPCDYCKVTRALRKAGSIDLGGRDGD